METRKLLVFIRAKLNLSQEALARELNVSFATVNRWELGRSTPSRKHMAAIADYCERKNIDINTVIN